MNNLCKPGDELLVRRSDGRWLPCTVAKRADGKITVQFEDSEKGKMMKTIPEASFSKHLKPPGQTNAKKARPPQESSSDEADDSDSSSDDSDDSDDDDDEAGKIPAQSKKRKRAPKKPPAKARSRKQKLYNTVTFIQPAIEQGLLIPDSDELVYIKGKMRKTAQLVQEKGKWKVQDEETNERYGTMSQWIIKGWNDASKNTAKMVSRLRAGKEVKLITILDQMEGNSSSSPRKRPALPPAKLPPCGMCSKAADASAPNSYVLCSVPASLRTKACRRLVHGQCLGIAGATQIKQSHIYLCDQCFLPYINAREGGNIVKYAKENREELVSIVESGHRAKELAAVLLDKGVSNTVFTDANGKPTDREASITVYSYRTHSAEHREWLSSVLKEVKPPLPSSELRSLSGTPKVKKEKEKESGKQAPAASKTSAPPCVINLEDDEAEEDVNMKALGYCDEVLAGKVQARSLTPMTVFCMRWWHGDPYQCYEAHSMGEAAFLPPDSGTVKFFDTVAANKAWLLFLQGTKDDGMSLVFWPGSDEAARAVPVSDLMEVQGAVDDEDVYLHFVVTQPELLSLKEATSNLYKRRRPVLKEPAAHLFPVTPAPSTPEKGDKATPPLHLVFLCHSPAPDPDERARMKAQHALLLRLTESRLAPLRRQRGSKALGEEICWVRTPSKDLAGLSQQICSYAPQTKLDRGGLLLDDYDRLRERRFINGDLINFYLRRLQQRRGPAVDAVGVFPTHFFPIVLQRFKSAQVPNAKDRQSTARLQWAGDLSDCPQLMMPGGRQRSILSFDHLIIPINDPCRHWMLGIVTNLSAVAKGGAPTFWYLDSLNGPEKIGFKEAMPRFLAYRVAAELDRAKAQKMAGPMPEKLSIASLWKSFTDPSNAKEEKVPQQLNHTDCGLHLITMAQLWMDSPPEGPKMGPEWFPASGIAGLRQEIKREVRVMTTEQSPELLSKLNLLDIDHQKWLEKYQEQKKNQETAKQKKLGK